MKYPLTCLFFSLLLVFSSCTNKNDSQKNIANHKLNGKVQAAVDSLSKVTAISIGGELRFKNLLKVATTKDLVFLTDNKNPIIRCYSFYGLQIRKYKDVREVFFGHLKDTAVVQTIYGCLGDHTTVMEIMLREFHPSIKQNPYRFDKEQYSKYDKIAQAYRKNIKHKAEPGYEEKVKKLKSYHLLYYQQYYWSDSEDKDFQEKRKLVKKGTLKFETYQDMVLATAYFEVNACHSHYPNVERKGDTIILKDQILKKYICDKEHRIIDKINFIIADDQGSKITTVIAE